MVPYSLEIGMAVGRPRDGLALGFDVCGGLGE